jgi:hypothetical protein
MGGHAACFSKRPGEALIGRPLSIPRRHIFLRDIDKISPRDKVTIRDSAQKTRGKMPRKKPHNNVSDYPLMDDNIDEIVVILEHDICSYTYSDDLLIYHIKEKRLFSPKVLADDRKFFEIFLDAITAAFHAQCPIITLGYFIEETQTAGVATWLVLSFFHNDPHSAKLKLSNGFSFLKKKKILLEEMQEYAFIKKYEVPPNFCISSDYLTSIYGNAKYGQPNSVPLP